MPGTIGGSSGSLDMSDTQYKALIASVQEANEARRLLYESGKRIELAQAELDSIRAELDREEPTG